MTGICKKNKQVVGWTVGWLSSDGKGFWALWDNIYQCVWGDSRCHGNAVKGF
jgi:hypothetical protein